ncbi:MAG TPA: lysylphosphatidylglycerol synthase transmembrane domain-containing protein [Terriglobia bacterium]|nr:lysylphosphatidylglycerol synthase transmembrane domain-containing protein [Terriglobia bacterium]
MNKNLRRWLGLGICAAILALGFYNLSRGEEWKHFDWAKVWLSLRAAQPVYLAGALVATYLTYFLRAYRWRFFLDPIKKASLWNLFVGQILGFSAVYLIGRWGEFVRPAYIAKREDVTFTSQAAIWLLERIYDMVFVILLFAVALTFGPLQPGTAHARHILRATRWVGLFIILLAFLIVAILVIFRLRAEELTSGTPRLFRFLSPRGQERLNRFLQSFADGLEVIENWRDFFSSLASTALLWFTNTCVFWLVMRSMGGDVGQLSWFASALVLVFSILGMLAPLPGIGGGFQVLSIYVMTGFFRVSPESATAASIMLWLMISVPCVLLGLALLVYEGLSVKKLGAMAEKEHATVAGKV